MPQMFGNLSIRPKLVALLAVPVAGTVLLGLTGAAADRGDRARAGDDRRLATLAGRAVTAVHELQEERARAVAWTACAGRGPGDGLAARRGRVDKALAAYRAGTAAIGVAGDPALARAVAVAAGRLDRLPVVRVEVDRRLVLPEQAMADLDRMVDGLLAVTRELTDRLDARAPARTARLLLALASANEATGGERSLLAAIPARAAGNTPAEPPPAGSAPAEPPPGGDVPDQLLAVRLSAAAAVARHELAGVRVAAGDRLDQIDRALAADDAGRVRRLELALLRPAEGPPAVGDPEPWRAGLAVRASALRRVELAVAADLDQAGRAELERQERRARDRLALAATVALATLAAALLLLGRLAGRTAQPEVAAAATVGGLARRGQALAERQLQLLEELIGDEPDPHRRHGLLGVDHLATRLRRATETLLAMAGPEPAGRWAGPVPLAVVLRAAATEADGSEPSQLGAPLGQGRRVDLLTTGEVEVAGAAGVDLAHLLAELLDNAASFSPPAAPIVVTAAGDGDGHLIEVADRGLGMTDQELAWANQRLAGDTVTDPAGPPAGDRLGLLIVGHLAARNGFGVRLDRSPAGGVTAAVRLPAALLSARAPAPTRPR
jgi:signal transduction histidine kinase